MQYHLIPKSKWRMLQHCWTPKSECPGIRKRLPRPLWPKSLSSIENPAVPLKQNLCVHPHARLLWKRPFEEVHLGPGWAKVQKWECLICSSGTRSIPVCIRGWRQIDWKDAKPQHDVEEIDETRLILENRHHFLTSCSRDALNVTVNRTKVLLINTEKCSNRESPLEQLKSYRDERNLMHKQ